MLHFREEIYPYAQQSMTVDELLYAGRSAYQDVLLFRNQFYGTVLVLDDVVQLSERDEFIYSEMIEHTASWSGFMEGALESAERLVEEILCRE